MLDQTTPETAIPAADTDWRDTLSHGDIVLFAFPVAEEDGSEEPKTRPCLVLNTRRILGCGYAEIAYGTSAFTQANTGYEIKLIRARDYRAAGLDRPTRFVGARRVLVPLAHSGFDLGKAGTPMIGRLRGTAFNRMNAVRARIQAERDIAADRRAERRREILEGRRPHRRPKRRTVVIERRTGRQINRPTAQTAKR